MPTAQPTPEEDAANELLTTEALVQESGGQWPRISEARTEGRVPPSRLVGISRPPNASTGAADSLKRRRRPALRNRTPDCGHARKGVRDRWPVYQTTTAGG